MIIKFEIPALTTDVNPYELLSQVVQSGGQNPKPEIILKSECLNWLRLMMAFEKLRF
jgi:hypothetical protein